jgi:hypothetical protein
MNPVTVKMSTSNSPEPIEQAIRHRAYELYLQRGMAHGHDVDDWLQAEAKSNSYRVIPTSECHAANLPSPDVPTADLRSVLTVARNAAEIFSAVCAMTTTRLIHA